MKDTVFYIRITACGIWFGCGIMAGGPTGYLSALASLGFFVAGCLERYVK